jgi:isoleucyl-tRNA synthetase
MADTRTVMKVVALGHAARNQAGIKVRQPLSLAVIKPRSGEEVAGLEALEEQIRDELNVAEVAITCEEAHIVDYRLRAVGRSVGAKFKSLLPAIRGALEDLEGEQARDAVARLREGKSIQLTAQVLDVTLEPEDVTVTVVAREGRSLAEDAGYMVALTTEIDEKLRLEGLAREIVRRIQTMRKEADFRIEDTIHTWYQASDSLAPVFKTWRKYIREETLSKQLRKGKPPVDAFVQTFDLDGESLTLGVQQVKKDNSE